MEVTANLGDKSEENKRWKIYVVTFIFDKYPLSH